MYWDNIPIADVDELNRRFEEVELEDPKPTIAAIVTADEATLALVEKLLERPKRAGLRIIIVSNRRFVF